MGLRFEEEEGGLNGLVESMVVNQMKFWNE